MASPRKGNTGFLGFMADDCARTNPPPVLRVSRLPVEVHVVPTTRSGPVSSKSLGTLGSRPNTAWLGLYPLCFCSSFLAAFRGRAHLHVTLDHAVLIGHPLPHLLRDAPVACSHAPPMCLAGGPMPLSELAETNLEATLESTAMVPLGPTPRAPSASGQKSSQLCGRWRRSR